MELIAKKPCSFGGCNFFIGEKIPAELVADPTAQEKLGVIAISKMQQISAELQETASEAYVGKFMIPVKTEDEEGDNAQYISLPMTPEGVVQVVSVLQSKANEGIEMINNISDENVLILIYALDSRVTVKNAAKKQAGTLTPAEPVKSDIQDGEE